ncbi:hypothetical protein J1N35_011998 [Gossypium stocksii]|uniref:Uncharacterized protein n=1 Tax=Gossypium stocksii TaxID=47602 RepID=A0A9D3W5A8_9ROSI|nr:hypothetical protein J1N35_011998 [Gossypium stocksii]
MYFLLKSNKVFYLKDPTDEGCYIVLRNTPRDLFDTAKSGGRRKTQGRTLLKGLYELNSIELVKVARNTHGQSIGLEARLLAGYLGIIAQNDNLLPINYESWHHMPDSNKNNALDNIKDYERVGTTSRQKQKFTHTARSKSFACVADDEELSSGQKVGNLQLFDITHRKKDGSPMTTEATEIVKKLKDKMAEYERITSSDSPVNLDNIDFQIITKVLGPKSMVRFDFKDILLTQPNILDLARSSTCLRGIRLKLKLRG